MTLSDYLPEVKAQYEIYPYPPRNPEQEKTHLRMPLLDALDVLNYYGFGGRRDFTRGVRVLVAGGGTGDAAIALAEQLRNTDAEVVYLDLSEASMDIARRRAEARGLGNITWRNGSLLDIAGGEPGEFDYINCTGVLHHLESPEKGLEALKSVLADDGVMGLMLYATYGRAPVYQVQELMRRVNAGEQDMPARIDNTIKSIDSLYSRHAFRQNLDVYMPELRSGPSGIYDLLLHSQDRPYTVPQLYDYIEGGGLEVLCLLSDTVFGNLAYDPSTYVRDPDLLARIQALPLKDRQAVAELLHGKLSKHTFYAARRAQPSPDTTEWDEWIPDFAIVYNEAARADLRRMCEVAGDTVEFHLSKGPEKFTLSARKTPNLTAILDRIDGRRTLREIFDDIHAATGADHAALSEEFDRFFRTLLSRQAILLRHKSVPGFETVEQMQRRIGERRGG